MQNVNENATAVITSIMSGISNFVRAMNTVNKGAEESYNNKKKQSGSSLNKSSIMSVSKDLVMSFPVICSTSLSSDTVLMIQRAIEINCVTTLQMIFASASLQGNNGIDVIKQWHNNISGDVSMDDYFDYIESLGDGLSDLAIKGTFESVDYVKKYGPMMIAECKRNEVFYPESSFSESSLLSFELSNGRDGELNIKTINEVSTDPGLGRVGVTINDPTSPSGSRVLWLDPKDYYNITKNGNVEYLVKMLEKIYNENLERDSKKAADDRDKERFIMDQIKSIQQQLDSKQAYIQKQLLDSDIKKANELVPSMMVIRYTALGKEIGFTPGANVKVVDEFVAGVKARLIGCDSVEIMDRIRLALENKVDLKNFIRATTGEIRFCKDFLLAIDQAKIEAKRNSKLSKTSPIWRALQNRSTKSVFKRISKKTNTAAAITTLVISSEEVNRLNTMYNIDLYNIPKLRQVMEAYNFMEVVIVDEALEVARFLFDNGDKYFQDYSFTALRKEVSESELKKVVNLMSSVNRG